MNNTHFIEIRTANDQLNQIETELVHVSMVMIKPTFL